MSIDWGHRLQAWAYKVIRDDVGLEFEKHLDDWKTHGDSLIGLANRALASHQGHLEAIKEELKAERQRQAQLAMFVLSVMSGPALSFVSASLEHRLAGKLFGARPHSEIRPVLNPNYPRAELPRPFPAGAGKAIKPESKRGSGAISDLAVTTGTKRVTSTRQTFDPTWANTKGQRWFYYGNQPWPIYEAHTINAIEAEMWALWIAQEDFSPITYLPHHDEGPRGKRMGKIEKVDLS